MDRMTLRFEPLATEHFDEWRAETREHLIQLQQQSGLRPGLQAEEHIDLMLPQLLPDGARTANALLLTIRSGDQEIGTLWLALLGEKAYVVAARFVRELTKSEAESVSEFVEDQARTDGATTLSVELFSHDAASAKLVDGRGFTRSSLQMVLDPLPEREAVDSRVAVLPMTEQRFARFATESEAGFAVELAATGRLTDEEATTEARRQFAHELPEGLATLDQHLYSAQVDGEEVGVLWLAIRSRGGRRHAFILDVAIEEAHRRKGYGRAILVAAEREARRWDAPSIGLHVFATNIAAVTLYEQLGYRRVMELLVLQL